MKKIMKYDEDDYLNEVKKYILSTYNQHYVGKEDQIQVLDLLESVGIVEEHIRASCIKYASKYGKKGGRNRDDLLKLAHYAILLLYFTDKKNLDIASK